MTVTHWKHLKRRHAAYAASVLTVALVALLVGGIAGRRRAPAPGTPAVTATGAIARYQQTLHDTPGDYRTWADLGAAYVQQARITVDPTYYPKADGALRRSLALDDTENYPAMVGMAALANARHDFAGAVRWGERAKKISPSNPDVFGTLGDAYTQLGDYPAATAAIGRMTALQPGVSSFTRASYELEQHGDVAGARRVLEQALQAAYTPADVAFCRYYLGELALHAGDLGQAAEQYGLARTADPTYVPALEGIAKTEALRGDSGSAVRDFQTVVGRIPQPQYVVEYAELLTSLKRGNEAARQRQVIDGEQRLFAANGVTDDLTASEYAADTGDAAGALAHARAEWARRRSVVVADALAWALHLNGKDTEALTYARQATRLGWRNAVFYQHKAAIEDAVGDTGAARADRATAQRANPHLDPAIPAIGRAT
ncbi:Tfp pilus assembly protein PilF [Actinoallomurus bryophytorum]|uniref:Tfp pilus assembly protein PilF n=1 Tax=Actinoallomurus bryophytorum TaxID=1490222 RepID=A0A543CHQ9_9ACTN|nr:Tfp pilus assembly protein PilF [Actinoallomurus bryophytorum]